MSSSAKVRTATGNAERHTSASVHDKLAAVAAGTSYRVVRTGAARHGGRVGWSDRRFRVRRRSPHDPNRCRGRTVSDGFRLARGAVAGYVDIDLEVPAYYIPVCVRAVREGADVATALRTYKFQLRSLDRYVMSKGYAWLMRRLLHVPLIDTETGFKFFRRERLVPLLDRVR